MSRVEFMTIPFDPETLGSAVQRCVAWCSADRRPHTIMTLNASHVCMMKDDPELDRACRQGDLIVADGMSVVAAAKLAGLPIPTRVAGVDLMAALLEEAGRHRLRVYFLGARREVVERLADKAQHDFPGLVVAGRRDGYFRTEDHAAIAREIASTQAHMLFIGMPSPFKETWGERFRNELNVPVIMGVGGSFDVLSGAIKRAPRLVQEIGMEWAWRLLMEPRKLFMRYLKTNSQFIWLALREVTRQRFQVLFSTGKPR